MEKGFLTVTPKYTIPAVPLTVNGQGLAVDAEVYGRTGWKSPESVYYWIGGRLVSPFEQRRRLRVTYSFQALFKLASWGPMSKLLPQRKGF